MPAEKVNDAGSPYHQMWVHWSRGLHVTVSTVATDPQNPTTDWGGIHVELDREGINRVIRALRKARDQAYGSDA